MSKNAFVMLTAERVEAGPINQVAGALQQETRLYSGQQCVCVLLVTFPVGSPEWEKWNAARTLDRAPVRNCETCAHGEVPSHQEPCSRCTVGFGPGGGHSDRWASR